MTPTSGTAGPAEQTLERTRSWFAADWSRWEQPIARLGERLNPILVKEARQALKSRQFLITFSLVLAFGWLWSLLGIALLSPGVYFAPGGPFMLAGYFLILAAPVLIVVPFSAFRSLAAEREDGTFELLSITALNSRQIVMGKLGSAVLQMLVYYSALSPCLAFTYLLRGVDIFTIVLILVLTLSASLLLSSLALMVAASARTRHWQVVVSVLLLIGLLLAGLIWCIVMLQSIISGEAGTFEEPEFWQLMVAALCFYASFVALFVVTAAGQLSFASDNRSTPARWVLLLQQALWIGWGSYAWLRSEEDELLYVFVLVAAVYWYLIGAILSGEQADLSPRVKRSLPQSFLGRALLTWFNPGSGTGYVFATVNLLSLTLIASCLGGVATLVAFGGAPDGNWIFFSTLLISYVVTYLGVGRLLLLCARRVVRVGVIVVLLFQLGIAFGGAAVPAFLQAWMQGYRNLEYSSWQASNWLWTLVEATDGNLWGHPAVPFLVFSAAPLVFVLNLFLTVKEVAQVRESTPPRVLADRESFRAPATLPWSQEQSFHL